MSDRDLLDRVGGNRKILTEQLPLSFADPRTHFQLIRGEAGKSGGYVNEPTGEVRCELCGATHTNIDEIPHSEDCAQRFVHSGYYVKQTRRGGVRTGHRASGKSDRSLGENDVEQ